MFSDLHHSLRLYAIDRKNSQRSLRNFKESRTFITGLLQQVTTALFALANQAPNIALGLIQQLNWRGTSDFPKFLAIIHLP